MRKAMAAGMLAGMGAFAPLAGAEAPARMAGLWLMNANFIESGRSSSFHVCVDKAHDELFAQPEGMPRTCAQGTWRPDGRMGMRYEASCRIGASSVSVHGSFSGDFQYNYQGDVKVSYVPPLDGLAEVTLKMDGRRLSPCKERHRPGVLLVPGAPGVGNPNLGTE